MLSTLFSKPLKETDGGKKVALPFLAYFAFFCVYMVLYFMMMLFVGSDNTGLAALSMILFYIVIFAMEIPIYIMVYYYGYEYTQAGLEDRETKAIWKNEYMDTIKKAGKVFIGYMAHSLIMIIPAVLVVAMVALLLIVENSALDVIAIVAGLSLGLVALIWAVWYYCYVYAPCYVYMIKTNTFTNVFKFSEAREFLSKGDGEFTTFWLVNLALIFAFYAAYFVFIFLSFILIGIPFLILTYIGLFYYSLIVFPMYLGTTVRNIENK